MHSKDLHTCRRVCDALSGLTWEDKLMHLSLVTEVVTGEMVGVSASKHMAACKRFATAYAQAVALLAAEMADEDMARKAAS